jgi:hypothetical protein
MQSGITFVMPGLDPGIHDEVPPPRHYVKLHLLVGLMDCRVKPGNDGGEATVVCLLQPDSVG